jgi:hypothetical protein
MLYSPDPMPESVDSLAKYIHNELMRVGAVLDTAIARNVEFLAVAPAKPREGVIAGADGTNWNPGAGKGVYAYYTGAWHLLG